MTEKEITWEWLAGFFDGEGCVRAYQGKQGQARPYVQMSQAAPRERVLYEISDFLNSQGINNRVFRNPAAKKHWNDYFGLQVIGRTHCAEFLRSVLPHLRVKTEEATTVLEYLDSNPSKRGGQNKKVIKKALVREMTRLWKEEGMTQTEIGNRFGVSQYMVSRLIQRNLTIAA